MSRRARISKFCAGRSLVCTLMKPVSVTTADSLMVSAKLPLPLKSMPAWASLKLSVVSPSLLKSKALSTLLLPRAFKTTSSMTAPGVALPLW